ncbi:hypothetical protein [Fervidobacterium thailandense]|nr:hypothetical protein [Fervidobacterium thailandense]
MGICKYCGKPAGLFKSKHRECESKHKLTFEQLVRVTLDTIAKSTSSKEFEELEKDINRIAPGGYLTASDIKSVLITAFEKAVDHFLNDGELSAEEQEKIERFVDFFKLDQNSLNRNDAWNKLVKGVVLREVMEGKIPQRLKVEGQLPFNFQKSEKLIWVFPKVDYYQDRTVREYIGGSSGVSFRVAKGVYLRTGAFKATPIETIKRVHVDSGILAVTTKHIYFHGKFKSFRIPFKKIVAFEPYSNGIGVHKDSAAAKREIFATGDGWFTYNLLVNLAQLSSED